MKEALYSFRWYFTNRLLGQFHEQFPDSGQKWSFLINKKYTKNIQKYAKMYIKIYKNKQKINKNIKNT